MVHLGARYPFFDKRMAGEVSGDSLGDEFKGYVFRIGGGNDKQGFPMKQGLLTSVQMHFMTGLIHSDLNYVPQLCQLWC